MPRRASNRTLFSALVQTQHFLQALKVTSTIRRIPFTQSAYTYLYQHWVPRAELSVEACGNTLLLDPEDMGMSRALLLAAGEWERPETEAFRSRVREGMTVIDIGANLGYYSLLAAQLVGPLGRVFAFEPSPRTFSFLEKSVAANGYRNITLVRKAVSDASGITQFQIDPESSGTHRISHHNSKPESILVETVSLDEYFAKGDARVDFIKIDAEGAEPLILAGIRGVIERNASLVLMTEFSPRAIGDFGLSAESFLNELRNFGFAIHPINESGPSAIPLSPIEDVEFISKSPSSNLLCLRHKTLAARSHES